MIQGEAAPNAGAGAGPGYWEAWGLETIVWGGIALAIVAALAAYFSPKSRERTIRLFASAVTGSAFAMFALIAGAVSQFYSSQITRGIPLRPFGDAPSWAPLVFWVFVVLTAACGIAYYAANGHIRDAEVKSLQAHTSTLVETLRTQPPEGFMRVYGRLCASMMATYTAAITEPSQENLRRGIRVALYTAAELAKVFDRGEPGETYSANLMSYRSADELGDPAAWSEEHLTLYPTGFRPARIIGALVLDPRLSTSSKSETAEPVPGLKRIRIVLPDPVQDARREGENVGRLRMLPGGAAALHLGAPFHVPDAKYMRETMRNMFSLEEAVISHRGVLPRGRRADGAQLRLPPALPGSGRDEGAADRRAERGVERPGHLRGERIADRAVLSGARAGPVRALGAVGGARSQRQRVPVGLYGA